MARDTESELDKDEPGPKGSSGAHPLDPPKGTAGHAQGFVKPYQEIERVAACLRPTASPGEAETLLHAHDGIFNGTELYMKLAPQP